MYVYHKCFVIEILLYIVTGATKPPPVLKKLIVLLKNIHLHYTKHQNLVYEVKPRHPIGLRLLKIGQMHSPYCRVTLILKKNIANIKISGYHPDGKRKFPCKFQLSLRGGKGREQTECDFEPFPI